ncbi:MAG: TnpV protein [Acutalibacteraceae bacterium]|nr:TnpV protein [Acutalibacteraceae bacterium]
MKNKEDVIMSTKNSISYRRVGDYFIPNLIIPPEEAKIALGKWGMMHKSYLEKHKKVFFSLLLSQGKLYQHCAEVENQAKDMYDTLIEQMKAKEGVTEELKEHNQWEWIQRMNNIQQIATEIVCNELIYT